MTYDLVIDMYCTPRAVAQGGSKMTSDLAVIAQTFAHDFVMPHLHQFQKHCATEGITPPALPRMFFVFDSIFIDQLYV